MKDKNVTLMVLGLVAVLTLSFFKGFSPMFSGSYAHAVRDLTVDLDVHLYILGWVIFVYGLYRYSKEQWF